MSNEELKEALVSRRPIILRLASLGDLEYAYVSAIIYRTDAAGKIFVQAECMDKCLHSVTVADPRSIFFKEETV